jgi:hypothetical protein
MFKCKVNAKSNVVSRLKFYDHTNGVLVFPVSSVVYAENAGMQEQFQ